MGRKPHKFDPANAAKLDRPERQNIMPNEAVVGMLDLSGSETVVDYGAGSGVLSIPVARNLPEGIVYAVDESPAMIEHLQRRLAASRLTNVRPELIRDNALDLAPGSVHRVLAVNFLHEVVGEGVLREMRRVLSPEGFLLVVDWRADVEQEAGPPAEVSLSPKPRARSSRRPDSTSLRSNPCRSLTTLPTSSGDPQKTGRNQRLREPGSILDSRHLVP